MEYPLMIKYLTFLVERADTLAKKEPVEDYDVAVLKRELGDFKARMKGVSTGHPAIDQSIASLELRASEKDADGESAGLMKLATMLLFHHGFAWRELERKRQLKVKSALTDFRNEVSHIHFALEI
ncbi:MAG: hypothetical protein QM760_04205 [Nibricoccus sp.]